MRRLRDVRPTRGLRAAVAALLVVLVGGVTTASASRLSVGATDGVASGTAPVAPPCDDTVSTRLVYEVAGGVDTDRVDGLEVGDVDAVACAGRTVSATAHDASGALLLAATAPLPAGHSSVLLGGLPPVLATSVHTVVVTLS